MKKVAAIYLAAGQSKRFSRDNKLFADVNSVPLGTIALKSVLKTEISDTIVVANYRDALFWNTIQDNVHLVYVKGDKGQSASLKAGVTYAEVLDAEAAVIILADQPLITKQSIEHLLTEYEKNIALAFVAYHVKGVIAPPLLISKKLYPKIYQLKGDIGARNLIKQELENGLLIKMEQEDFLMDIDTQEDFEQYLKVLDDNGSV